MSKTAPRGWFETIPNYPIHQPREPLWLPPEMSTPPQFDECPAACAVERRLVPNPELANQSEKMNPCATPFPASV